MNEIVGEEQASKAKKIRRILLLKTDKELKKSSKINSNIMINSKTTQELNKTYNSYKILLSERTIIYSNYVTIVSKIVPNEDNKPIIHRKTQAKNFEELNLKIMNSSFESNSPDINYFPSKIDLGKKKFSYRKKGSLNSPHFFEEKILKENKAKENEANKSTKLNKKNIIKVIDKIAMIKLHTDMENEYITKNFIKLRKYCNKLIKKKKKAKKTIKLRQKLNKRKTLIASNIIFRKSLFGSKDNNIEEKITKDDSFRKPHRHFNEKIIEKDDFLSNKTSNQRVQKICSFKDLDTIKAKEKEKEKTTGKNKKFLRLQTLNYNNKESDINLNSNHKNKIELNKNEAILNKANIILKGHIYSTKMTRPPKFVIINNNINNANIFVKKGGIKKNSLFDHKRMTNMEKSLVKSNDNSKENDKPKQISPTKSVKRNAKQTVKVYNNQFNHLKMYSNS